jgi:nucleoid DNA-binding protein
VSQNNLKKIDLIKNLSLKTGLSKNLSKKIVDDLINIIIKNIKSGKLNLKNIGLIKTINKKERVGRNPRTKEEFKISARKVTSYTPSKSITVILDKIL